MEFSYYPGCTLKGSAQELDDSFQSVAQKLGVTLKELPDWTCCGASSAHMVDAYLETALPARDLQTAERLGKDVVAPCAGCHVRMKAAMKHILADKKLQTRFPLKGEIEIISGTEFFFRDEIVVALKQAVTKPLTGLKVVPYYGCLAVRPVDVVQPKDPENPMQMDHILEVLGAEVLRWPYKTDCCGGSLALTKTELVLKLSGKLIDMAKALDADALVTMCPMCQANLDTRQADLTRLGSKVYDLPIFYLTELMGVAMGIPKVGHWFGKHMVSPESALKRRGLL
jgi:heterodisulfide reductase subunit B2